MIIISTFLTLFQTYFPALESFWKFREISKMSWKSIILVVLSLHYILPLTLQITERKLEYSVRLNSLSEI